MEKTPYWKWISNYRKFIIPNLKKSSEKSWLSKDDPSNVNERYASAIEKALQDPENKQDYRQAMRLLVSSFLDENYDSNMTYEDVPTPKEAISIFMQMWSEQFKNLSIIELYELLWRMWQDLMPSDFPAIFRQSYHSNKKALLKEIESSIDIIKIWSQDILSHITKGEDMKLLYSLLLIREDLNRQIYWRWDIWAKEKREVEAIQKDLKNSPDNKSVLNENELKNLCFQLSWLNELQKLIRISQIAKQKWTTSEIILSEIRNYKKRQIREKEKWNLRHYHRTSIDKFRTIAEIGLLSRSKIKKLRPDIFLPGWSASDNVMMTRDKYDLTWKITEAWFSSNEVVWASGSEIILVLKDNIMNKDDYDSIWAYPTISELSLNEYCEVILLKDPANLLKIKTILQNNNLDIPVMLLDDWKR